MIGIQTHVLAVANRALLHYSGVCTNYGLASTQGYQPWKGDKVSVTVADNGTTQVIRSVTPFSKQSYTGKTYR